MDPDTEVGIWRRATGLNVTAVRRVPDVSIDGDGVITAVSVWRGTTIDGAELVPSERIQLQIDGVWPEEDPSTNDGVYTFSCGTTSLTLHPDQ